MHWVLWLAVDPTDERVIDLYATKEIIHGTIAKSFFEEGGWQAPAEDTVYQWWFDPRTGWSNRSKGFMMFLFQGWSKRVKVSLAKLLEHDLYVTPLFDSASVRIALALHDLSTA